MKQSPSSLTPPPPPSSLAPCPQDRTLRLWNPARGTHVKTYTGHGYEVRDVAVSSDSTRLASVGGDRAVVGWDVATGAVLRKWRGHDGPANCVVMGPNADATIVTGGDDASVRVWDARSRNPEPIAIIRCARDAVTSVALAPPATILSASVDGCVRAHDVRGGTRTEDALPSPLVAIALTRDGGAVAAAGTDGVVRLLDRATGTELARYAGAPPSDVKTGVGVTADDATIVAGCADGRVRLWDLVSERVTACLDAAPPGRPVTAVAVHPREVGGVLAGSVDGVVRVFE